MNSPTVKIISNCFIKPKHELPNSNKNPIFLGQFDLAMLSVHYIQKGLLFNKHHHDDKSSILALLATLKDSLALALDDFYPLAGRLSTTIHEDEHSCSTFINPVKGLGAGFIHARVDMCINDVFSTVDIPRVVQSFFDHDRAVNHDGHDRPLVSVQVTELVDGVFFGCSMNHAVADGTSFWHFFNTWSRIHMTGNRGIDGSIPWPPIHERWFLDSSNPSFKLPFVQPDEFVSAYEAPEMRERIFHFSAHSLKAIKARANSDFDRAIISSFQALSALVWRCIIRARRQPRDQETSCRIAINNRLRLEPPVSQAYFGNLIQTVRGITLAGELLENSLGWAAMLLHQAVIGHNDKAVRETCKAWVKSPFVYQLGAFFDPNSVMMGSSPRFDMYGNEFGLGKAVAVLSGYGNKFDGKVTAYQGYEGEGSVDLEICLSPASMSALESDDEFMEAVSPSHFELA
ncbi:hypothetical protein Droror1_Dr00016054 [Drosera rotundifolia]